MDKEHVKGAVDKASGAIKEAVGKATGDASLQAKGKIDKAKGEAREKLGDVKDALKDKGH
ncbi:MAG: CsbD family protein [Hyphomonadaceae bacterium]|nr:CsbD family protein [Hyphomonadaceae bacterium]GIK47727.1 MAG: CsbD family protein [Alphaproteobacteria bacterium]